MTAEKRHTERMPHEATIIFEHFATRQYHEGRLLNFSRGGMCFASNFAPEVGAEIFIGIDKSPFSKNHDIYRAKVVWNRPLAEGDARFNFGVGVRFC